MRIQLISDGSIPVPPINGWGALERVVWNYKIYLEKEGHDVLITNDKESSRVLEDWRRFKPDVVHNHIGKHWEAFSLIGSNNTKKFFTNHGGGIRVNKGSIEFWKYVSRFLTDAKGLMLTNLEVDRLSSFGIDCTVFPNGVDTSIMCFDETPLHKSIYLGKIMSLKRQALFQRNGLDVIFAGNKEDTNFDYTADNYIGNWTYEKVRSDLTKFSNLVLLSIDELQPLVCLEAMSAGLGLVLSEPASQSLDISKSWISVIKEKEIEDIDYINHKIKENIDISIKNRKEIREYAKEFDWSNIIKKYLKIINN